MDNKPTNKGEWVSASCEGEKCSLCGKPASNKIAEVIMHDDPNKMRHELTQYVCKEHFEKILMPYKTQSPSTEVKGQQDLFAFAKRCFYKGFEKAEKDDANCYTAWREEAQSLIASQPQEVGQDELWQELFSDIGNAHKLAKLKSKFTLIKK